MKLSKALIRKQAQNGRRILLAKDDGDGLQTALQDILTDLMHACDAYKGLNFLDALGSAREHHAIETGAIEEHGNNPPMINGHPTEPTLARKDLIKDNHGRLCIVIERDETPGAAWILGQVDKRIRDLPETEIWFKAFPLDGGSVCVPQSLCQRVRKATKKDVANARGNANGFAQDELDALFRAF